MDCVGHIVYLDVVLVDQGHVDRVVHGHVDRVVVLESVGRVGQNVLEKICGKYIHLNNYSIYSVFRKNCVFFQEFSLFCHLSLASTRLLLVVQKTNALR